VPLETEPQKIRLELSPQAERYARRDAPREVRLMAARGALPLPPVELATVLFAQLHDPDPEVKSTAGETLATLPDRLCEAVLSGPAHPALLSHLAHAFQDDENRLAKLALNPATDDSTVAFLASRPFKAIVDIVSNNQERMLRAPDIVDSLGANPLTGRSIIDRILSFLGVEAAGAEADGAAGGPDAISDAEAEAALRAVLGEELGEFAQALVEEGDGDDFGPGSNLYSIIQHMSVFQKVKLGRLGNKEARGLLVHDRNKVVAIAALSSPKIGQIEVVGITQSRSVCEEVLRLIAMNREWTRNYKVKLNLVTNPKCPQALALKFLNYLQEKDLRSIMRSKDVHTAVSTHARRILTKKGKL
jgi:hypothetical protein